MTVAGICAVAGACPFGTASQESLGLGAGAGIEYAAGPWQFRVEYLHYDLGTLSFVMRDRRSPAPRSPPRPRFSGDMVRGAITYRFNWTLLGLLFGTDRHLISNTRPDEKQPAHGPAVLLDRLSTCRWRGGMTGAGWSAIGGRLGLRLVARGYDRRNW